MRKRPELAGEGEGGWGADASLLLKGEKNTPPRRMIDLYTLPEPAHAAPFRRMIAHPVVCARLEWMLGKGFHEAVPPEASIWRRGSAGIHLHGMGTAGGADFLRGRGLNVAWQLRDCNAADGGFACVPGSHNSPRPIPRPMETSLELPQVKHVGMKAGDVLFFANAHAALAWTSDVDRANVIHKYAGRDWQLPVNHCE